MDKVGEEMKMVVECCPYCDTEIEMRWDTSKQGFKAFCPVCGEQLMLCNECEYQNGEFIGGCDYNGKADICKHNRYDKGKTLTLEFKVVSFPLFGQIHNIVCICFTTHLDNAFVVI